MQTSAPAEDDLRLSIKVLGLYSGISMNVIQCVHVHYTQTTHSDVLRMEILDFGSIPHSPPLRQRVLRLINEKVTTSEQIAQINYQLGEEFAQAIHLFCTEYGIDLATQVDLISSHGQMIWHLPLPQLSGATMRTHLDMAEMAIIAARTGKTTVSHFRVGDQAHGRQGGPLTAFSDALMLVHPDKTRACQSIGDIASVCFIPAGDVEGCYEFDIGPGTILIDAAVRYFTDGDGENEYSVHESMGRHGKVDQSVVNEFLSGPYFVHNIPKTCGREIFSDSVAYDLCERMADNAFSPEDCIATITRITAQAIVQHYRLYGPPRVDEIFVYGEGSLNPNIMDYLRQEMPGVELMTLEDIGIPGEAKEAVAFAQLGVECLLGRPPIVPQRVETRAPAILGQIQPGRNWRKLILHASKFWDGEQLDGTADCVTEMVIVRDSI